jgi:hypothetical protein
VDETPIRFKATETNRQSSWQRALPISVFTNDASSMLTRVAHNDSRTGEDVIYQGYVGLRPVAGQTYYIQLTDTRKTNLMRGIDFVTEPIDAPQPSQVGMMGAWSITRPGGFTEWTVYSRVHTEVDMPANYMVNFFWGKSLANLERLFWEPRFVGQGIDEPTATNSFLGAIMHSREILAGEPLYLQARVWHAGFGNTYEEARAAGGPVGKSRMIVMRAGSELDGPCYPVDLGDITVRAPMQPFSPGRLDPASMAPLTFDLVGEPGLYAIERMDVLDRWWGEFVTIVTNLSGRATWAAPNPTNQTQFYRSRLLD